MAVVVCPLTEKETPKLGERWGPDPLRCGGGVADSLEMRPSPRVILPNLVVLGQTVRA